MVYTLRFFPLQNAVCFIILAYLVSVLFAFYIQGVLELKNNSSAKRLKAGVLRFRVNRRIILKEVESNRMGTGCNRHGTVSSFLNTIMGFRVTLLLTSWKIIKCLPWDWLIERTTLVRVNLCVNWGVYYFKKDIDEALLTGYEQLLEVGWLRKPSNSQNLIPTDHFVWNYDRT